MRIERVLSLGLASFLAVGDLLADSATVRVPAANIRSAPTAVARVVASVRQGDVLEVLETRGEWRHVRTRDAVDGWIAARLVDLVATPAPPPRQPARTAGQTAPPPPAPGVAIDHKAVGCLVAEEYPRLEACFAPSEALGRAQVQFRGSETSPWYAVDMKPDGPCYSAWLPKPKKETSSIDYFVFAIDKQFVETQRPEKAPGEPYTPRVVRKRSECDQLKALAAWSAKTAPRILLNVVRDAGGKVLDAAAAAGQAAGAPAGVAGFSNDGVVVSNAGGSAGSSSSTAAAASHGIPVIAVVGGVAAAGGIVAVAAKGGGGGGSTGSGSSGTGGSSTPSAQSLSGAWAGTAASGAGWSVHVFVTGGDCTYGYDTSGTLVQSGNTLTGPLTTTLRSLTCNPGDLATIISQLVPNFLGSSGGGALMATLQPPGAITVPLGNGVTLTGTYTATRIRVTGHQATADFSGDYILDISKR
jgi:Bacterial SH3 domain